MSKIHNVIAGDRITNLSIKYYGTASKTSLIINANPQLTGRKISLENLPTIYPGDILNIPDEVQNVVNIPEKKTFPAAIPIQERDTIAFLIDTNTLSFFNEYNLNQSIDSFDNISFSLPFDDKQVLYTQNFKPFSYQDCGVYYDGNLIFGGTMISVIPESNPDSKTLNISVYPKCGVVNDCQVPISLYPIEFQKQDLEQICNKLLTPFGISAIFQDDKGNKFDKVAPDPEQKILDFLISLAQQRGLLITNSPQGNLLFLKANVKGESVANIKEGNQPFLSCTPTFNEQEYYSHITGLIPTTKEKKSEKYTWENPFLKGVLRPFTFIVEDSDSKDIKKVVEQKAGRMFGSVCAYTLTLQGHRDEKGNLYTKNTIITVYAPGSAIYKETRFLIKGVSLKRSVDGGDITTMSLVLPESYTGEIPKDVSWQI